jgi:putative PIG3 family NAD(P)H quinone oxidoreductase
MRYIEITKHGGPEVLTPVQGPMPEPGPGQVLVRVQAAGVNRPDVAQRQGHYPPPPGASPIPGLEIAGTVERVGANVSSPAKGDSVCALVTGGGYAEYCVAEAVCCLPIPKGLSFEEAAALPETFFTVWTNLFDRAALKAGETLLVHGGSSGIGTVAIQLAANFGARVFTTAGSEEKCNACRRLGAELAINYRTRDFVAEVLRATENRGVDVILDMVAGDYIPRNIKAAAEEGRIVMIAGLGGFSAEVNFLPVMLKRLVLTGSTLRARPPAFKGRIAANLRQHVWPLLEARKIAPVIHKVLPLAQAAEAHRMMEAGEHIGKIVLAIV